MSDSIEPVPDRRQVFAFIALASAPLPYSVKWHEETGEWRLRFDQVTDLYVWAELLGLAEPRRIHSSIGNDSFVVASGRWRGLQFWLHADEPPKHIVEPPVDEATRVQLEVLATPREELERADREVQENQVLAYAATLVDEDRSAHAEQIRETAAGIRERRASAERGAER